MKLVLRKARLWDEKDIIALNRLCFSVPWSDEAIREDMQTHSYFVAEAAGKVIGYAAVWVVSPQSDLADICIHPRLRGRGLGDRLLKYALAEAYRMGAEVMTLEVRTSNAAGIALYEKNGFARIAVRKQYYIDNREDALIMQKRGITGGII